MKSFLNQWVIMKTIDTLVKDIEDIINSNDHNVQQEIVRIFGNNLGDVIAARLFKGSSDVQELRMSNIGTPCERKLWYSVSDKHVPAPLPVEAKVKFLYGDILEELLLFLAAEAGHRVEYRQHEVEINGVKGHIDAIIDGVLIDVKSTSSRSFDKFKKHELAFDDPFGYIDQINAYHFACMRNNLPVSPNLVGFLVIDKTLGHIHLDTYVPNMVNYNDLVEHKRAVLANPKPPERRYSDEPDGKSGNRKLATPCGYCDYRNTCWPGIRTFLYANGPRYLTNVERIPDVPEVFD